MINQSSREPTKPFNKSIEQSSHQASSVFKSDEPFNHLDELSIAILNQTFLDHVNNYGMILFASHFNPTISKLEIIDFN